MTPVMQTRFGDPDGNCLQAAIASILDLALDAVPSFGDLGDEWGGHFDRFLADFGIQAANIAAPPGNGDWVPAGYHLIGGRTHRGILHSVVGYRGKMIHDPHPGGAGLVSEDSWMIFVAMLDGVKIDASG